MSVLIETSLGDMVFDLHTDMCPKACTNFLKLCKIKYYNNCIFHSVEKDFIAQAGDPTGTGKGGESIFAKVHGPERKFFEDEIHDEIKHKNIGTLAYVNKGPNTNASQFYITLRSDIDFLDGKYTIFGEIAEGEDVLDRINAAYCDKSNRPYRNIRIKHTHILEDPFPDVLSVEEPASPPPARDERPEADDEIVEGDDMSIAEAERATKAAEAKSRAVVLEMIGDIPDAEMKPPENVLFVCKLNPITQDPDLDIIFGRFGPCTSNIIRDKKTGDSLNYAFIEFETQEAAEVAYEKMNNVIIDDRRIKVDFSQSAYKQWRSFNLERREKMINKRRELAKNLQSQGGITAPSSQVVGGNDYQREVSNKWHSSSTHGSKPFSANAEARLGGFRDRKDAKGRGGKFDISGSSKPEDDAKEDGRGDGREKERARYRDRSRERDGDRDRKYRDRSRDRERSPRRDRDDRRRERSRSAERRR